MPWLACGTGLCRMTVRQAVRRLIARGVVDLIERNTQTGYLVRVRLPQELRAIRAARIAASRPAPPPRDPLNIEDTDFMQTKVLRRAVHERERGHCFYCLRRISHRRRCLDCNSNKKDRSAEEHLRWLFRERRLSVTELNGRLRAHDNLAAGKLLPPPPGQAGITGKVDSST